MPTSPMHTVLGFDDGEIDASVFTGAQGSVLTTTVNKASISIVAGVSDQLSVTFVNQITPTVITLTPGIGITLGKYVGTLNGLFTAANVPITATYNSGTQRVTFTNVTTDYPFVFNAAPQSTCFLNFGITITQSTITGTNCTLTSQNLVDLSGNNSFYITTNLALGNYSFLNSNYKGVNNVLAKIQFTTESGGLEFYNNFTSFKTRFYDTNITKLHIVLYDENFKPWIPLSDWSLCN